MLTTPWALIWLQSQDCLIAQCHFRTVLPLNKFRLMLSRQQHSSMSFIIASPFLVGRESLLMMSPHRREPTFCLDTRGDPLESDLVKCTLTTTAAQCAQRRKKTKEKRIGKLIWYLSSRALQHRAYPTRSSARPSAVVMMAKSWPGTSYYLATTTIALHSSKAKNYALECEYIPTWNKSAY